MHKISRTNITLKKKKWKNGKVINILLGATMIYSYPIFNFTVHHYVFFMTREISRNINCCKYLVSLLLSFSLFLTARFKSNSPRENIFTIFFFFFQALHLDSFVPTLRPLITRCDLLKNVQFICCAFDVLFLHRRFSNTFLGIALIRR